MAAKGSRLRFELGRFEVAGVVVSTAAGLFVVFLLGIYAGRGMAERQLDFDKQVVRLPFNPAETVQQGSDELRFYETLGQQEAEAGPGNALPALDAAGEVKPIASAAALDEENLPERDAAAVAKVPVQLSEPALAELATKPATMPATRREQRSAPRLEQPEARVALAIVDEEPAAPAAVPAPASGGEWSVQVAATRDPRHAESVKRQLTTAGYRAYIVKVRRQGETFHRVRVGQYPSLDQARQVASLLRRQPGVTGAFVASD